MEMVIALSIMTIVFASILPLFGQMRKSWDAKQAAAETLQNGRILIDHLNRNISKAVKITAVSDWSQTIGYIEYEDNDAETIRYDVNSTSDYVEFGQVGNLSDLAGPVSRLKFTCYDACDLDNPLDISTADINDIRFVKVETILTNLAPLGRDKTLVASAYLRTNASSERGLAGWWKLDEISGLTAEDSSCNGNNGTLTNMAGDEWTTGQLDGALEFDGSNDYVNVDDAASLDITNAITVMAWIKPSNPSGNWQSIVANSPTGGQYNYWFYLESNALKLSVYSSTYPNLIVSNAISAANAWYHVAFTALDGSTTKIFVNGNEVGSRTAGTEHWAGGYTTISDLRPSRNICFAGTIDDVRIYNRALSAEEIEELANIFTYMDFTEAKADSDTTSITISTPDTNEGDLLITAIATDGDTSASMVSPMGEGWTEIDVDDYGNEVTLGAWWKNADASESSSHQFTWSAGNPQQAYGWMMRFTGHDPTNPVDDWATDGECSSTPTSPEVTTTVNNCLILRLGAFDDDDVNSLPEPGNPGLSGHTTITMEMSESSGSTGWWKLDETSGTNAGDSSGNGNDGTLINMSGNEWTTGQIDGALEFDGNNDCVGCGDLRPITAYTAAAWIKADNLAGSGDLNTYGFTIMASAHSGQGYPLWLTVGKGGATEVTLRAFESSTTGHTTTNANLNTVDWFYIVATAIKGSTAKVYVNSVEKLSFTAGTTNWTDIFTIGDLRPYRLICFDGTIDDVRIYNRALNADEITALYNGEEIGGSGAPVSGGAGYIRQSSSGDSGTSTFSLGSANEAKTLTIAIAPDNENGGGFGTIRP